MSDYGVTQFLLKHAGLNPVSFHMPGHKGSHLYRRFGYDDFINKMLDCDITEIPGADNLFQTESIIKETADKYTELYDVKKSYLLINGTSGGILAAIMAVVPQGKKLIMARNCHKSVFNALTLGNIEPVYAYPTVIEEYGISGAVEPQEIARLLIENPEAEAVILPSPNYYGICSDIKAIADIVHKHGKILITDQAHGAHLKFFSKFGQPNDMPLPAEECGADITINSTHKTLASMTQSAVLNLNSDRVERYILEDKLQAVQSTSPSYVMMASLDINADIIKEHGRELFKEWQESISWFYEEAKRIPSMKIMEAGGYMDKTKINLDMSEYGIDGNELDQILLRENIVAELVTGNILMCMTGVGNTRSDMRKLAAALAAAAKAGRQRSAGGGSICKKSMAEGVLLWNRKRALHKIPAKKMPLDIDSCAGRICASSIIPYPPGIPFICPGEEIGAEEIAYIKLLRAAGEKVIGVNEKNEVVVGL